MLKKYMLDLIDLGITSEVSGEYRAFAVTATGNNLVELLNNSTIFETDQDGEDVRDYPLSDASNTIQIHTENVITQYLVDKFYEERESAEDYKTNQAIDERTPMTDSNDAAEDLGDMLRKANIEDGLLLPIQQAVEKLYYWQTGGTSFTCKLFELMCKADSTNLAKLTAAYPNEAYALGQWRQSPDPRSFFRRHGLGV